jgi:hypothetical protein
MIASTTLLASKKSDGKTIELPCVNEARKPRTSPKQWNRGGGQQITSDGVSRKASPTKRALLRRLLGHIRRVSFHQWLSIGSLMLTGVSTLQLSGSQWYLFEHLSDNGRVEEYMSLTRGKL